MLDSNEVYDIVSSGTYEQRKALMDGLPENSMKSSATSLIQSDEPSMQLLAFGSLLPGYVHGANCVVGVPLGLALYQLGKELFLSGNSPDLYLMTVLGYAYNYVTALSNLGEFETGLSFIENEMPFWTEYEKNSAKLNEKERTSFNDNLKSLLVAKIGILVNLDRYDDAELLAKNSPRVEGNWSSDIELQRLRKLIKAKKRTVGDMAGDEKSRRLEFEEGQDDSTKNIMDSLKKMMNQYGMDSNLVDKLASSAKSDPYTKSGFKQMEDSLTRGESFLQRGGGQEANEVSIRQAIRRSSGIFVDNQPSDAQIRESLEELSRALDQARAIDNNTLINDAYYGIYLCYSRLGRSSDAADQLIALRKNLELTRRGIADPKERGGIFHTYPYLFYSTVEHLYKSSRDEDMLDAIEGSKGQTIADSLALESTESAPFETYGIRERLSPLLARENANYISYHVDDDSTYISMLTKTGNISSHQVLFGKKQLSRWFKKGLQDPKRWNEIFSRTDIKKELAPLVTCLKSSLLEGSVEEGDHICYSADHLLYQFPLHYLSIGNKALIDLFTVSRIHNAGHLILLLSQPRPIPETCLTVTVPSVKDAKSPDTVKLFHASADLLAEAYDQRIVHLSGVEADRSKISSGLSNNQLVHFATHGFFPLSDNPFHNSGLLIADQGELPELHLGDPNYKYMNEGEQLASPKRLLDQNYRKLILDNSHISLQACVAGFAREGIAGDALGLEWAFFQCGAGSITSTFWNIGLENANKFYEGFYELWIRNGKSKAEAHRKSLLGLKNRTHPDHHPHEYYWAGFGLIGDWR